jgi:Mn-dependent DtxR family transcriptional regulator
VPLAAAYARPRQQRRLSVRRPSVSMVASPLQKAGLIKYSRGRIRVLDVKGLQKRACECYGTVKGHYQRLVLD